MQTAHASHARRDTVPTSDIWQLSLRQSLQEVSATRVILAAVQMVLVRVALVVIGFDRTLRLVRRLSGQRRRDDIPDQELAAAVYRVAVASAFITFRGARCLERSLVLFYQLKRAGVPVALRVGANARPFTAHAWVEYDGQPINERWDTISDFSVLLEVR